MHSVKLFAAIILFGLSVADLHAQPAINTKNFAVDCRPLQGNPASGSRSARGTQSGFTIVLSNDAHAYYKAPAAPDCGIDRRR